MIKSNINIISNIYIREHNSIRDDRKYTKKITGAKRLQNLQMQYHGLNSIPLTSVQKKIAQESVRCSNAKNGEMSYGAVMIDGVMQWINRCEYTRCPIYDTEKCKVNKISRENILEDTEKEDLQKFLKSVGITIEDDTVTFERDKNPDKNYVEEQPKEYKEPAELPVSDVKSLSEKYINITSPDCIINSPLDSHIILNSGPGTGKTYTIIQRLIYILKNRLCPSDEIYILCYTRSAKKVIEDKIEDAVTDGTLEPSAKNICLLTFDSYAAYFLMAMKEQGVISEDFTGYGYNERIKLFNKYISPEDFEDISYFIVDEIQDLVNERAEMVLNILKNLNCGYLLAGDRCQSIYDYEADNDATLDSAKFYELAEKQFPGDTLRYEISVNKRQTAELAEKSAEMRKVLLNESYKEQNRYANNVIKNYSENIKIEAYIRSMRSSPSVSTAILCRTNGEAEYISALLCKNKIFHVLNRGVNNTITLPRWIADIFWDYCDENISKNDFVERSKFRCNSDFDCEKIWEHFCKITKTQDKSVINMQKLKSALRITRDIPNDFYDETSLLTVSTIHKAKGSEFDRVVLVVSDINLSDNSAEEARVRYVALTRAKIQLVAMKRNPKFFKRIPSGRVIETGLHKLYDYKNKFCKSIAAGLTGDIDNISFVLGDFQSAVECQKYILSNVKLFDCVEAEYDSDTNVFNIIHNGRTIGCLSEKMTAEIISGVKSTDYKNNIPNRLENLYVSGITSEILGKFSSHIPIEFQKSGICFGIQITGLAKLKFEKK